MQVNGSNPVAADCTGGSTTGSYFRNAEVEPSLAIDRSRSSRLLAAWQQDRWSNGMARALVSASSQDGGATWQQVLHPMSRCGGAAAGSSGDFERATDPWVEFASDGTAFLMGLATTGAMLTDGSQSAMLVSRSTDGGRTWDTPVKLIHDFGVHHNDKNTLTADPVEPRRVYAVWNRLDRSGSATTMFARSTNGGRSWEPARAIVTPRPPGGVLQPGDRSKTIGNRIVVVESGDHRGTLVNLFTQTDIVGGVTSLRIGAVHSTDGGTTWSAPVYVEALRTAGTRDVESGKRIRDGNILPAVAGGPDGSVWVAWQDSRFSTGRFDAIVAARSRDGGRTWSAPVVVNRVTSAPAFTPVVHVRADGRVGVLHFDLRSDTDDPATLWADAWLVTSSDGVRWDETHVTGPFDMSRAPDVNGLFIGDYHGLASIGRDYVALLALPNTDTANRTDVKRFLVDIDAQAPVFVAPAMLQQPSPPAAEAQTD